MCPTDDTFLSGSVDDTVRVWDLRADKAQGLLNIAGNPCIAFDNSGMVFAVALNLRSTVLLYDLKAFDRAPFATTHINDPVFTKGYSPRIPIYTSLRFSPDGKYLLLGTSGDVHYVMDGFDAFLIARLEGHVGLEKVGLRESDPLPPPRIGASGQELSWTPDGRFVVSGSADGKLHIWDVNPPDAASNEERARVVQTLLPIKSFDGHGSGPSRIVGFNHKMAMMVSGGDELAFWIPDSRELLGAGQGIGTAVLSESQSVSAGALM